MRSNSAKLQAARERELEIASEIQQTLLSDPLPADLHGLRIGAASAPSREFRGDFYYGYEHEDRQVDLIVADVPGQGIRASVLGSAIKSRLLEALCHLLGAAVPGVLPQPKEIVTLAHAALVRRPIESQRCVSLCYVRIDPERRAIEFVAAGNAGLTHFEAARGRCQTLHGDDFPLGCRTGAIYDQSAVSFEPDDLLVLCSAGVAGARNAAGEPFGEARLTEWIESRRGMAPDEMAAGLCRASLAFTESESPAEGLNCVVIQAAESERPRAHAKMELGSEFGELARAREFIRGFCRQLSGARLDGAFVANLELAVTEACSNIIKHAFHGRTDQHIQLEAEDFADRLSIRLHHLGEAFDPSSVPQPRLDGPQESGLGVYLIAHSVETVRYYVDERGRNCIALTKNR
ncbi:MAG TPA: SpoIIE family protein phosphatase [Pirellulales bacterium]|nr:SpoIIE family protein phosphatase [Pirellulales bacterium]